MIFTRDGSPLREALYNTALVLASKTPQHLVRNSPPLASDGTRLLQRTVRDRLGDILRIVRGLPLPGRMLRSWGGEELRGMRAKNGVGRPNRRRRWIMPAPYVHAEQHGKFENMVQAAAGSAPSGRRLGTEWPKHDPTRPIAKFHHTALVEHGSQRAAARALGMNLSTFQRRLAKEAAQ